MRKADDYTLSRQWRSGNASLVVNWALKMISILLLLLHNKAMKKQIKRIIAASCLIYISFSKPVWAIEQKNGCEIKNQAEFLKLNEDINVEYNKNDSKEYISDTKKAFWISGNSKNSKALFLIHGYMGSPREMLYLAEPFIKEGYSIIGFLIPGHGASYFTANNFKQERWIQELKKQLSLLTNCFSEVRAIGFSTGGLLLHHYLTHNQTPESLKSLHLISPYFIQRFGGFFDQFFGFFLEGASVNTVYSLTRFRDFKVMTIDKDFYHQRIPILTGLEIKSLGIKVYNQKPIEKKIQLPVQVFLTEGDWTVDINKSREVIQRDYSNPQIVWYRGSDPHHLMAPAVSAVANDVQNLIYQFSKSKITRVEALEAN